MKKVLQILLFSFIFPAIVSAQQETKLTSEDVLNRMINNPDFIQDVSNLSSEELTVEKLGGFIQKYVPESNGTSFNGSSLDFNKLYFANTSGTSPEQLVNKFGALLNLNPAQVQHMNNTLTGNLTYTSTSNLSTGITGSLYERGKDAKVDYAVDYAVDFFQNEFGDGGLKSTLIDVGGGLMGSAILAINKRYEEKMAAEAVKYEAMGYSNIYAMGKSAVTKQKDVDDLLAHYDANKKTDKNMNFGLETDYEGAIPLYTKAIEGYGQKPERAYYMYQAYLGRARSKMQLGAYRAAIIDYYFAQVVLDNILNGHLPDKSINSYYPPGYHAKPTASGARQISHTVGTLTKTDKVALLISRGYAKYRAGDHTGAMADCREAENMLNGINPQPTNSPYSYKDIIQAVKGMAAFGQKNYQLSYNAFASAATGDLIVDKDNDSRLDLFDLDRAGLSYIRDDAEGLKFLNLNGLPEYFPFDVVQIKGLSYYKAGKVSEAIALYESITGAENGTAQYTGNEKKLFTMTGGDISSVYATLGNYYVAKGEKQKALAMLDKAVSTNPSQLEYYASRANCKKALGDTKGSQADWAIVKDPSLLSVRKKSEDYYKTRLMELSTANNNTEAVELLKEAAALYPKNEFFFTALVSAVRKERSADKAKSAAAAVAGNKKRSHMLNALAFRYSDDLANEETEVFAAFGEGLGFYEAKALQLDLFQRPYYCKLLQQYADKKNNSFIPLDFNEEKTVKWLDSIYNSMPIYQTATGFMKKTLDATREREYAKNLGHIEEYLGMLEKEKMLLEMSPIISMDAIECMYILDRDAETGKFAKKMLAAGKMEKKDTKESDIWIVHNNYLEGVQYIAKGCE